MATDLDFSRVLRRTTENIRESLKLAERSRRTLQESAVMMDQSRKLLSEWPTYSTARLSWSPWQGEDASRSLLGESELPAEASPTQAEAQLERIADQTFTGQTLRLDGRHFVDCNVENCTLEYSGGPLVLESTHFSGCRFRFAAEAALTVSVLECFGLVEPKAVDKVTSQQHASGQQRVN